MCKKHQHKWTKAESDHLVKNFRTKPYKVVAAELGLDRRQIMNRLRTLGLKLPAKEAKRRTSIGEFKKGQIAWNNGVRGYMGANKTSFKKGNLPANTLHDGAITIRIDKDTGISYKWIRLSKNKWRELHRYIWEKKFGKVPESFVLRFKDGNSMNVCLENIELIHRSVHLDKNRPADLYQNYLKYKISSDRYVLHKLGVKDRKLQKEIIEKYPEIIELKRMELKLNYEFRNAS